MGTARSLFEKEGGVTGIVEDSKFESNYCKILQVIIILHRALVPVGEIIDFMN